jgi:hypothetical protein
MRRDKLLPVLSTCHSHSCLPSELQPERHPPLWQSAARGAPGARLPQAGAAPGADAPAAHSPGGAPRRTPPSARARTASRSCRSCRARRRAEPGAAARPGALAPCRLPRCPQSRTARPRRAHRAAGMRPAQGATRWKQIHTALRRCFRPCAAPTLRGLDKVEGLALSSKQDASIAIVMQAETSALGRVCGPPMCSAPHQRLGVYDEVRRAGEQGKQVASAVPCAEACAVYAGRLQLSLHP